MLDRTHLATTSERTINDAIIVGLGAMGSAAACHLARRGARVVGIDRHRPPHPFGSSHGYTRIIRQAYFEHPLYVPLVQRAYACWHELERLAGEPLLVPTGGLMIGPPEGEVVSGALRSARSHGLAHRVLDADEARAEYPAFVLPPDQVAVFEPDAGYLLPERCIAAHLALARQHGADLRVDETVVRWEPVRGGVRVITDRGVHEARRVVLAAGAWLPAMVPGLLPATPMMLRVERNVQHWFAPAGDASRLARLRGAQFPVFIWEHALPGIPANAWYGFPLREEGIKLALHHGGETTTAMSVRREVAPEEVDVVWALVRTFLPDADGPLRESSVCLYTNTPDDHFILDTPAAMLEVIVASPCSGHGFKFSSVIGETIADLVLDGGSRFDLSPFRLDRFVRSDGASDDGAPSPSPLP